MNDGEHMKNKFLRLCLVILIMCSFVLGGCVGAGDPPTDTLDPKITDAANNAEEILKTKDNITIYKDENGNNNNGKGADLFGDAIVFIDPGSEGKFVDHYTNEETTFGDLVKREIDYFAKILTDSIGDFYIKEIPDGLLKFNLYNFIDGIDGTVPMYDSEQRIVDGYIDVNNFLYLSAVAKIYGTDENYALPQVIYGEKQADDSVTEKQEDYFNFSKAVFGGVKRQIVEVTSEGATVNYEIFTGSNEFKTDYRWALIDNTGLAVGSSASEILTQLQEEIKVMIASAVSGISIPANYSVTNRATVYAQLVEKIDHLGFTATDLKFISETILAHILGKDAVNEDDRIAGEIKRDFGDRITSTNMTAEPDGGVKNYRDYKAYRTAITEMVARTAKTTYEKITPEGAKNEGIFIKFPRISIMAVDIDYLMDNEQFGEVGDDSPEIGDTGYEVPDVDPSEFENGKTTLDEKFDKELKIVGILLMPNAVKGDRTMARKENGEWVYEDSDKQTVAKKTFEVDGFLVTSVDVALLCEAENTAMIDANVKIHTSQKEVTSNTGAMDVGYVKPEAGDDNFSYSAEILDGQTTMIAEEKDVIKSTNEDEGTLESFRIGGYNGVKLVVNGTVGSFMLDGVEVSKANGVASENGKYTTFTLNTNLYEYIGVDDVNGEDVEEEDKTTFAGYLLNLNNYAGKNYIQIDFTILAVNDDTENRDVKINILSLMANAN